MTLQMGHHERLQEARKKSANSCSCSRQDQHPLPSQILHLQLHPNSRIQVFWIKPIYRKKKKKRAVTYAYTLQELRFVVKAKFLLAACSKLQKKLFEIRPPKKSPLG